MVGLEGKGGKQGPPKPPTKQPTSTAEVVCVCFMLQLGGVRSLQISILYFYPIIVYRTRHDASNLYRPIGNMINPIPDSFVVVFFWLVNVLRHNVDGYVCIVYAYRP